MEIQLITMKIIMTGLDNGGRDTLFSEINLAKSTAKSIGNLGMNTAKSLSNTVLSGISPYFKK